MKRPSFLRRGDPGRPQLRPEQRQNSYYENISARFGVGQVVLYLSLLAFVVLSFLANTELITYENFYYFFQDLRAGAGDRGSMENEELSYPTDEEQSFALYRGGLAVAGNRAVTIFSATGRQALSVTVDYRDPVAVGAGKYLLVYERGGTHYSLYNSTVQIHSGVSEKPIYSAAVSDSGMYALVSSSDSHPTVVLLYSSRFSMIARYHRTGYVTGVALDPDGERIALLVSEAYEGGIRSSLILFDPRREEPIATVTVGESMGLSCSFTDSGGVVALTKDGIVFLSRRGVPEQQHSFSMGTLLSGKLGGEGAVAVLKKNGLSGKKVVIVFDKEGKIVYNEAVTGEVRQPTLGEKAVFWLTEEGVCRLIPSTGEILCIPATTHRRILLPVSDRAVLLCSPQKAVYADLPA